MNQPASPITTHVLDLAAGRPARGVAVVLAILDRDGHWSTLGGGTTDADGRLRDLLDPESPLEAGTYRLRFDTGAYFAAAGIAAFYPAVAVEFTIGDPAAHHHVPLLLSPFGYSTYRGS